MQIKCKQKFSVILFTYNFVNLLCICMPIIIIFTLRLFLSIYSLLALHNIIFLVSAENQIIREKKHLILINFISLIFLMHEIKNYSYIFT